MRIEGSATSATAPLCPVRTGLRPLFPEVFGLWIHFGLCQQGMQHGEPSAVLPGERASPRQLYHYYRNWRSIYVRRLWIARLMSSKAHHGHHRGPVRAQGAASTNQPGPIRLLTTPPLATPCSLSFRPPISRYLQPAFPPQKTGPTSYYRFLYPTSANPIRVEGPHLAAPPLSTGPSSNSHSFVVAHGPMNLTLGGPLATFSRNPRIHRLPFPSCDPRACCRTPARPSDAGRGPLQLLASLGRRHVSFGTCLPEFHAAPAGPYSTPWTNSPVVTQTRGSSEAFFLLIRPVA